MKRRAALLLACLLPAACGNLPIRTVDTAQLAPGQLGSLINLDVSAVQQAQWAFADPGRTRDRPAEAARATAAMDYIAGQLYTSPRWANISALTKEQLLQGRVQVRQVLGIVPDAPSQVVVNSLSGAFNALAAGNEPAAVAALSNPAFAQPGEQTLQRLANLPYIQMANVSTMRAANELFRPEGSIRF